MNNNRNNRRRGRGNRNQGGNGAQLNRIDSRARGNAPQMLDKYKKLAQDAHHNGDRVQMEYYLQFADHYFRVIADNKARQDEQRGPRRGDEREQVEDYGDDDLDFGRRGEPMPRPRYEQNDNDTRGEANGNSFEGEPGQEGESFLTDERDDYRAEAQPRQDNARRQQRRPRDDRGESQGRGERQPRGERGERQPRGERPARAERSDAGEAAEPRAEKPARGRKPRKAAEDDRSGFDSTILPPAIGNDDAGDSDGALESVG